MFSSLFREKRALPSNKITFGKILEIHKFTWFPFSLMLSLIFQNNSVRMSLMTALFGSYGVLWVIKSNFFYDKNFYFDEKYEYTMTQGIFASTNITIYFLFPIIAVINKNEINYISIIISLFLYIVGTFFHYAADVQKYYTLKYRKGLITEDLYSIVRHPNYTGEFLIWIGLIGIAGPNYFTSYFPLIWLSLATLVVGIPEKEKSLSRYEGYLEWKEKTHFLIPYIY